jgi:multiple sugar transport system permease protein
VSRPRERRRTGARAAGGTLKYVAVAIPAAAMLAPFLLVLSTSLMTPRELLRSPPPLLPGDPQWHSYSDVTHVVPLGRAYVNSLVVAGLTTLGVLATSALCGYALAKYRFPGQKLLFVTMLSSLMIPPFAIVIPLFWLTKEVGWLDSFPGLIVPFMFSGYGVFLMRQFLLDFPTDLIHAARIDGASEPGIFLSIVAPLMGPAFATLGAFTFVATWNSLLWPLLVVQSPDLQTIPLALNSLRAYGEEEKFRNLQMAGTALGVIPALFLFVFLQRYFSRGVVLSGLRE